MNSTRIVLALTVVNLGLVALHLGRLPFASAKEDVPMLRGSGLEIVDAEGRVRFQVKLEPANPTYKWPDGSRTGIPETVIVRMSTADGKPRVKMTTSVEGSGLMLLGDSDTTHTILQADGKATSLKLRNDEAKQTTLKP